MLSATQVFSLMTLVLGGAIGFVSSFFTSQATLKAQRQQAKEQRTHALRMRELEGFIADTQILALVTRDLLNGLAQILMHQRGELGGKPIPAAEWDKRIETLSDRGDEALARLEVSGHTGVAEAYFDFWRAARTSLLASEHPGESDYDRYDRGLSQMNGARDRLLELVDKERQELERTAVDASV